MSDTENTENGSDDGFNVSIEMLIDHSREIPPGWRRIYDDCIASLKSVACAMRANLRLLPPETDVGLLGIECHNEPSSRPDAVVCGILRKLREKSKFTCEICGMFAIFSGIPSCPRALCPKCSALRETRWEVDFWQDKLSSKFAMARMEHAIAIVNLPLCIRELIPADSVRRLRVSDGGATVKYVLASDMRKLQPELAKIGRLLIE
jgi:hypothetical protein